MQHHPCWRCGSEFVAPKVRDMRDARYVNQFPHLWESVDVTIQCDDCGYETEFVLGCTKAWEQWDQHKESDNV